jgi:hypothetical protein
MTTLDNNAANRTDYKFRIEEPNFLGPISYDYNAIMISAIRNDTLYTLNYFATPETFNIYLPIVQKMISSLKITEPSKAMPVI